MHLDLSDGLEWAFTAKYTLFSWTNVFGVSLNIPFIMYKYIFWKKHFPVFCMQFFSVRTSFGFIQGPIIYLNHQKIRPRPKSWLTKYIMQAECISFHPYVDQMNNFVWSHFKLRLKASNYFTLNSFQKAFNDELQIMEQNYLKMTLTR